jgi:catechol 2,3-dioxygenase-like lactoylglutathione lyase family enzyme
MRGVGHDRSVTTLDHVALAVRDPGLSLAFYRDVLDIDGTIREESYGFVISTTNGMSFTLFHGEPPSTMGDFHIGVGLSSASAVREARTRFRAVQLIEHEWCDEEGYVSVKVHDPDGYLVEVSWDVDHPAS